MQTITYEENENGKYKIIEQANGVKIRILREPSREYMKKSAQMKKRLAAEEQKKAAERNKQNAIDEEIKRIAIENLKTKGVLDRNGNYKGEK